MTSPGIFGLVKRILPFAAALLVGVFITSLFVDIRTPRFGGGWKAKRHQEYRRLKAENEQLRNENLRLRNENESQRWDGMKNRHPGHERFSEFDADNMVPPPPIAPLAPAAPRTAR